MKIRTRVLQDAADAEIAGMVRTVPQAEALLATVRAQLAAASYDAPGREKLEARSRALFAWIQQRAPQSEALKPSTTIKPTLNELEAGIERDHVFATCTDPAVELQTVRDEIVICDRQIQTAQAAEESARGAAALRAAAARCLDLYGRRRRLEHRSLALSALVRVASPHQPALATL